MCYSSDRNSDVADAFFCLLFMSPPSLPSILSFGGPDPPSCLLCVPNSLRSRAVSEGEAVAALASSLSLSPSPRQEPEEAAAAAAAAVSAGELLEGMGEAEEGAAGGLAALLQEADFAVATFDAAADAGETPSAGAESGATSAPPSTGDGTGDVGGAAALPAAAAAAGTAAATAQDDDAMDVDDGDGGVEESKGQDGQEAEEKEASGDGGDGPGSGGDRMQDDEGEEGGSGEPAAGDSGENAAGEGEGAAGAAEGALVCPPGMDPEVFAQLPAEMQQEVIREHRSTMGSMEDQADLLEAAGLDPEALAALPPDMRREVLEQEARNRRMREAPGGSGGSGGGSGAGPPADPSHAAEMDNASIVATLPPEVRREVLLSADETLLSTLPPNLVAEAMVLRERIPHQAEFQAAQAAQAAGYAAGARAGAAAGRAAAAAGVQPGSRAAQVAAAAGAARQVAEAKNAHEGEWKLEADLKGTDTTPPQVPRETLVMLIRLLHLLTPIRPHRLLQRTGLNLCGGHPAVRCARACFLSVVPSPSLPSLFVDCRSQRGFRGRATLPPPPPTHALMNT